MAEFETLRQWDSLLLCLRLLDKGPQALDLIHRRLEVHVTPSHTSLSVYICM